MLEKTFRLTNSTTNQLPDNFCHLMMASNILIFFSYDYLVQVCISSYNIIFEVKMNKPSPKIAKTRSSSVDNKQKPKPASTITKRITSDLQSTHLADKTKKLFKKLIPSQPINLLKKLVQKGTDMKKQILPHHNLLPSLTTKNILLEIIHEQQTSTFHQVSQSLTFDMLSFQRNINKTLENSDMGEIVKMQTAKCRRNIPALYFQHEMEDEEVDNLLTRDREKSINMRDDLVDYLDEVEFNVNQQVTYKLSIFMSFVGYLTNLRQLADLSISKIQGTRQNNQVIRYIVIQKASTVNRLRRRKQQIEKNIHVLNKVKKLKRLEDWFMNQVHAKGKITALNQYPQYCSLHDELKAYCCPRMLCKYFDVAYYIERGYSDSFTRSLKSYLTQIILINEKHITDICFPSKSNFATTTPGTLFTSLSDACTNLDESLELEQDDIELVSKHNIEREIASIYKQGLHKCSYSTDEICEEVRLTLGNCQLTLYNLIKGTNNLGQQPMTPQERRAALEKLATHKYVRIVEHWSDRMKKVVKRQLAIIQRALRATADLQSQQPQKYEVMCSYLMQILYLTFTFIDQSLSFLISSRKFKQQQSDFIKQILLYQQQWKDLIVQQRHYPNIWQQFSLHFLEQQFDPQHKENKIVEGLIGNLKNSRRNIVQIMINGYNNNAIDNLIKNLQEQFWKVASIPSRFYRLIGEVLYGKTFTKDLEQAELKLLSSSLLLDKNSSFSTSTISVNEPPPPIEPIKTQEELSSLYQIQLSESMVRLTNKPFKLTTSSIYVCQALQGYLEWIDESSQEERVQQLILKKIEDYLIIYNNYVRDLILDKKALNFGKIKIKSITGKHLLITYAQLKFIGKLNHALAERFPKYQYASENVGQKLQKHMADVSKKFRSILQLSIRQSINKMVVDPRTQIKWPIRESQQIVSALSHSRHYVQDILMSDSQMSQFIGVNWCSLYLEKLKAQYKSVYKQIMNSNGTRKSKDIDWTDNIYWKYKELEYIVQNLKELQDFMPGFGQIVEELEQERKKLDNPH